jgi:adenylate cyclase
MLLVDYEQEKVVQVEQPGRTILSISRDNGIPHASACGGHARCSTCRVRILRGGENLSPPGEPEARLTAVKGLDADTRLACQARVLGSVTLRRLVHDACDVLLAEADAPHSAGKEVSLAVLFSDIRGFTPFVETHLAYDVVHILNRYFYHMGEAVLRHGGYIDKYIGDGLMALFGKDGADPARACREAVDAALAMVAELPRLNDYLGRQFGTSFDIGVGVHFGEVILADVGHPRVRQLTAIGDTVNVASRIESATRSLGARLLASEALVRLLPGELELGRQIRTPLKGKSEEHLLYEVLGRASARSGDGRSEPATRDSPMP